MDVLILNWKDIKHPQAGGAEVIAFELAKRFAKAGHTVTFFSRTYSGCLSKEVVDDVTILRQGGMLSVYLKAFFYYQSLEKKPDRVIDMINTIGWFTPLYVEKKRRFAYLNQLANEVWFYEFPFVLAFLGYIVERIEYVFYRTTKFICYSQSTKEDLISFGIPDKHIATFHIGIDHQRYFPKGKKTPFPLFIFVARLVAMKKADICIQAMKEVVTSFPQAKLAIIGRGRQEEVLEAYVKSHDLENNVIFVTKNNFFMKKNPKDMKVKLMREAWVLLLPSVKEGWGLVVTEAAACGTASIVSNVTGLKDSVLPDKTGIIISQHPKPSELAQAMQQLIIDTTLREKLSSNAIIYAKKFSWEKSYNEFYHLISM